MKNTLWIRNLIGVLILFSLIHQPQTQAIIVGDCDKTLVKLVQNPLRTVGTPTQEHFFQLIDQVAREFGKKPEFISPVAWRKRTASEGLPGLDLPKEVGGKDLPASDMIKVFEHAGRYDLNLRDVAGGAHSRVLLHSKNPEHKKILEQFARGEGYMAIAITEPETGSNIRGMRSTAKKVPGGYELTGEKLYNARFETATHIILFTQAPGQEGKPGKLNTFVIPKDYPGLSFSKLETQALKGNSLGEFPLTNFSFRIRLESERMGMVVK
ncbi:MAG: acyl-CoA dehydrogenase family protein, partial [Deltaproteobacteria bacterium]